MLYYCLDENQIDPEKIREAGDTIKRGGLVAFPTETVYGLGGDALNPESSGRIYAAKGRPSDNPLIVHIAEISDLPKIAAGIPEAAYTLADRFWPGPLTMIFRKQSCVPDETTGGLATVAVRMPDHPIALALIRAAGGFIAAPSANLSGRPSPTSGKHVLEDMDGRIDMILDGGSCRIGLESTILDLSEDVPAILRPGYITRRMLQDVIGEVTVDPAVEGKTDAAPKAPGMKYKHYAPKGALTIVSGEREAVVAYIQAQIKAAKGQRTGVIASEETYDRYRADVVQNIGAAEDEEAIARHLYDVLRTFDEKQTELIFSEAFNAGPIGQAIMNRLIRAAGHHIIEVS
ncbi:MAG: threonylcarbamoyl-AMP synthase [Lachnospiraceae bacterium]|nr:threonylcarbamoyl-AMP synthase [Lachnospiraceae bacterium]